MIVQIILIIIIFITIISLKNDGKAKALENVYGYPPLPIIGNMHQIGFNSLDIFKNLCKLWSDSGYSTFKLTLGNTQFVCVSEPHTVENILTSTEELTKGDDYEFFKVWLGDGLILSSGNKWHKARRLIGPSFHFKILEKFIGVFNKTTDVLIEVLNEEVEKTVDIYQIFSLFAFDLIVESVMGVKLNSLKGKLNDYAYAVYRLCEIMHLKSYSVKHRFPIFHKWTSAYKEERKCIETIHGFSNKIIQTRKTTLDIENSHSHNNVEERKKLTFLDLLLMTKNDDGTFLSHESIREQVDNFVFAGHDTTAAFFSFTLFVLSKYPKIQQRVFEEQCSIFGSDKSKDVSIEDISNMKYLDLVIKESLRMYPPGPLILRKMRNDLKLKDGTVLPAGVTAMIFIYGLENNPKHVHNPENFNPDRFLLENIKGKNPFSHIPFSAGPRNCIGQKFAMQEAKTVLSKLIRNFEFYNEGLEDQKLQLVFEISLKSKNGIHLKLRPRKY